MGLSVEKRILWIASYPKSGNTWIRAFFTAYLNEGKISINEILPFSDTAPYFYKLVTVKDIGDVETVEFLLLKPAMLMHMIAANSKKGFLITKTHDANIIVTGQQVIPEYLTRKAIYIVRDPRDMVISFNSYLTDSPGLDVVINSFGKQSTTLKKHHNMHHILTSWSMHVISWLDEKKFPVMHVRYEDLLKEPHRQFRAMIEFYDLDYNKTLTDKCLKNCSFAELRNQENEFGFTESTSQNKFFRIGKDNQWQDILTEKQINKIRDDHREVMERLGYL